MDLYNHWLTSYAEEIIQRNASPIILNTGKTTSGKIHIGILRELVICDALQRILEKEEHKSKFLFFIDDFDSAKHFPDYVPAKFEKYLGMPFSDIPDPKPLL